MASSVPSTASRITTNSSPARRPTRSARGEIPSKRRAMTLRNSSPLTCPSVSLTALNRSTSMNRSPTWPPDPAVWSRRRCSSPRRTPRLARPVSGSWVAWNFSWRSVWRWRVMSLNEHTTPSTARRAAQPHRLGVGGNPSSVAGGIVDAGHHVQLGHARTQGDSGRVLVRRERLPPFVHDLQAGEQVEPARGLLDRRAEHRPGRLVDHHESPGGVDHDDALVEGVDGGGEALLGSAPLGHVAEDHLEGGLAVPRGAHARRLDDQLGAVGPHEAGLGRLRDRRRARSGRRSG